MSPNGTTPQLFGCHKIRENSRAFLAIVVSSLATALLKRSARLDPLLPFCTASSLPPSSRSLCKSRNHARYKCQYLVRRGLVPGRGVGRGEATFAGVLQLLSSTRFCSPEISTIMSRRYNSYNYMLQHRPSEGTTGTLKRRIVVSARRCIRFE